MRIYTLNKTGKFHDTHTEDHVFIQEMSADRIVGAVMDGCSSGKETYFASTLYGKLLRKACGQLYSACQPEPGDPTSSLSEASLGQCILKNVFEDLGRVHHLLHTEITEMLSTLILMVFNPISGSAWINVSGDGFVAQDQTITEIDQNNVPDYMAYHLDISFQQWMSCCTKTHLMDKLTNVAISTDGVSKFISHHDFRQHQVNTAEYFLTDSSYMESKDMLDEKLKLLERDHGLIPYDDLGIVRIVRTI